jgi:hypothetical protein
VLPLSARNSLATESRTGSSVALSGQRKSDRHPSLQGERGGRSSACAVENAHTLSHSHCLTIVVRDVGGTEPHRAADAAAVVADAAGELREVVQVDDVVEPATQKNGRRIKSRQTVTCEASVSHGAPSHL